MQRNLPFPYTPAALAALDAIVAALLGEGPAPELAPDVFDELGAAGDLWAWDALERDSGDAVDWADPDAADLETMRWYDEAADPYGPDHVDDCAFILGTHRPHWICPKSTREQKPEGPLFVSARQLRHARHRAWPLCDTAFAIDSGGFTELRQNGGWITTPEAYAEQVAALRDQTGTLMWAAIQDWMVEDDALRRTGLTIEEHQRRTVASFLRLRELAPDVRWLPVLQGQSLDDYLAHLDMYAAAGVHLPTMSLVGVGSVCRRERSTEIEDILRELAARGLKLHGFGVKTGGLERSAAYLASADSLAWSLGARKRGAPNDRNSQVVAEQYRAAMLAIPGVVNNRQEIERQPL